MISRFNSSIFAKLLSLGFQHLTLCGARYCVCEYTVDHSLQGKGLAGECKWKNNCLRWNYAQIDPRSICSEKYAIQTFRVLKSYTSRMSKAVEHQHHSQQPYPVQMPSAPPTYDEAIHGVPVNQQYATQANPPYPQQYPVYATQPIPGFQPQHGFNEGYVPAPGTYVQPSVVEIQRTVVALPLGPSPARLKCPNCQADVRTCTEVEPSCAAHLCCLLLLLIGCCPFSSLPYCMDSLKNVRHSCPNCHMVLGSYQP